MGSKIINIEYYLPEKILSNKELEEENPEWNAAKIEKKIGIRQRHIAATGETALDMGVIAGEKALKDYDRNKIDLIILCTQSPDYFLPTSACIIQDKLGLKKNAGAFDFNLGCSGYIYGLAMAKGFINSGIASSVLLIMSETYSKHINKDDIGNRSIFGDGASATIIERSTEENIFEFELGTDGSGANNLIVPGGCFRKTETKEAELYMNGPEIFNFTIETVPELIQNTLKKNQLNIDEIDHFVFHQANKYMLEYLRKKQGIPEEKFFNNLLLTGNTVSSTIPIAIKTLQNENKIQSGQKIMLCGFGVGYSWGAVVITI